MGAGGILRIVGVVVAIGVAVAWQFFGGDLQVWMNNSGGRGWDAARPEVVAAMKAQMVGLPIDEAKKQALAECVADKAVAFLNGTECSYYYNTARMTEAEHTAAQEACMAKVGYPEQEAKFAEECMKSLGLAE